MPRRLTVPIGAGSEPDLIEIEDIHDAIGEFQDIDTPCDRSPSGQCEYSMSDNFRCCIHCGKESGL